MGCGGVPDGHASGLVSVPSYDQLYQIMTDSFRLPRSSHEYHAWLSLLYDRRVSGIRRRRWTNDVYQWCL